MEEELVSGDFFSQLTRIGCVKLDPQVQSHMVSQVASDLATDSLGGVKPVGLVVGVLK